MSDFLQEDSLKRDPGLNKLILDTFSGAAIGFGAGFLLSIFFKKPIRIMAIGSGIGGGIAYENNGGNFNPFAVDEKVIQNRNTDGYWKEKPWLKFEKKND